MMKKIIYILLPVLFVSLSFVFISSVSDSNQLVVKSPSRTIAPDIPKSMSFAGQTFDLSSFENRERMDRELMAFSYMHSSTLQMIKRANRYFPIIEPILKEQRMPSDLKYLMAIESGINPFAYSRAGAAGLWQFMRTTGREFGLEVNKNIDERYHVRKATIAACKYLRKAYERYQDWGLVVLSYNAGQGRISSEMRKQKEKDPMNLWLNTETSRYLFRILTAKYLFEDPQRLGFALQSKDLYPPLQYKEVTTTKQIDCLADFAKAHGVTYAQLKRANPWLRGRFLQNRSHKKYTLLIPTSESMNYNPHKTKAYSRSWVVNE